MSKPANFTGGGEQWEIRGSSIIGKHQTAHGVGVLEVATLGVRVTVGPQLDVGLHPFELARNARVIAAAPLLYTAARDTYRETFGELARLHRVSTDGKLDAAAVAKALEAAEERLAQALAAAEPGACGACRGTGRTVTLSGCADGAADYDSEPCFECDGSGDLVLR